MFFTSVLNDSYPEYLQGMKDIQGVLAENLIRIREERGMTQSELAEKSDFSLSAIQTIEYATRWPGIETIRQIAKVLRVPVANLFMTGTAESRAEPSLTDAFKIIERESEKLFSIPADVTDMLLSIESEAHWDYIRTLLKGIGLEKKGNSNHHSKDRKKG